MKPSKKQIAIAVAVALAIVLPWMIFGGDLGTSEAWAPNPSHGNNSMTGHCWWNIFCLGFCNCS